jgi:peptide chain release factor 2
VSPIDERSEGLGQRIAALGVRATSLGEHLNPHALDATVAELEQRLQEPGFWDDAAAAQVSTEHASARDRVAEYRSIQQELSDLETLVELADGEDDDGEFLTEVISGIERVDAQLGRLEEARLFSGEHDAGDAVMTINAGEGGTDAQDWAEMMVRMYARWTAPRPASRARP